MLCNEVLKDQWFTVSEQGLLFIARYLYSKCWSLSGSDSICGRNGWAIFHVRTVLHKIQASAVPSVSIQILTLFIPNSIRFFRNSKPLIQIGCRYFLPMLRTRASHWFCCRKELVGHITWKYNEEDDFRDICGADDRQEEQIVELQLDPG